MAELDSALPGTFEEARRRQLTAGLDATPAQRLEWLGEMLDLASAAGALPGAPTGRKREPAGD